MERDSIDRTRDVDPIGHRNSTLQTDRTIAHFSRLQAWTHCRPAIGFRFNLRWILVDE